MVAAMCLALANGARASDMDVVRERFLGLLVPTDQSSIDSLKRSVQEDLLPKFNSSCLFSDIDYNSRRRAGWPVMGHLSRMYEFALLAHVDKSTAAELVPKTACGLDWWFRVRPECPNWYDQQISGPNNLGQTLLVLPPGALLPNQSAVARELIAEATWWKGWTGSNLLYMLRAQIMRGLSFNNETAVAQGFKVGLASLVLSPQGTDGVQHDGSFHQHGPQLLAGSYGAEYTGHCLELAFLGQGTPWAAPNASIGILSQLLLDGQQWMMTFDQSSTKAGRDVYFDWQVTGRSTTNPPGTSRATGFITPQLVHGIASTNASGRQDDWKAFAARFDGSVASPPKLEGSRVYWDSDYVSHARAGWRYTLHTHSSRTIGGSCVNDQGKLARRMSNGAAALYYRGDEYTDTYPTWDYRRPPGVSGPINDGFKLDCGNAKTMGSSPNVGATTTGTGYSVAAMAMADKEELEGRRAWILLDHAVVVLGSGLVTPRKGASLATTLDTTRLRGDVYAGATSSEAAAPTPLPHGDHWLPAGTDWLLHGSTGYVLPSSPAVAGPSPPARVHVHNANSTGDWSDLGVATGTVTLPVFDAWLEHNTSSSAEGSAGASFAYVLLPEVASPEAMPGLARAAAGLVIRRQGEPFASQELVLDPAAGAMGAVVWSPNAGDSGPGSRGFEPVSGGKGWGVAATAHCLVALHDVSPGRAVLAVSTPGAYGVELALYLDRAVACSGCKAVPGGWTRVDVVTPGSSSNDETGRPVVVDLTPA